ncbi:unnamed protein product [Musa hybrid cultivar]
MIRGSYVVQSSSIPFPPLPATISSSILDVTPQLMARNFSIVFCSRGSLSLFGVIFLFLGLFRFGLGFLALDSESGGPDRGCVAGELMKKRFLDVHPVEERVVVLAEDALRVCKTTARRCDGLPEGEGKEHGRGAATTSDLVSRFVWLYPMSLYKRLFCVQQQQQNVFYWSRKRRQLLCVKKSDKFWQSDAAHSVFGQTKGLRIGGYQQPAGGELLMEDGDGEGTCKLD